MLDIDGLRLQQSLAIIEYLEERNPEPALLPPNARRPRRALAQLIACEVHPLNNLRALSGCTRSSAPTTSRSASGIAIGATRPFPPSRPRWAKTTARPTRWATRPASSSVS